MKNEIDYEDKINKLSICLSEVVNILKTLKKDLLNLENTKVNLENENNNLIKQRDKEKIELTDRRNSFDKFLKGENEFLSNERNKIKALILEADQKKKDADKKSSDIEGKLAELNRRIKDVEVKETEVNKKLKEIDDFLKNQKR